jgi:hypothetical protein
MKIMDDYYYNFRNHKTVLPIDSKKPWLGGVSSTNPVCSIMTKLNKSVASTVSALTSKQVFSYSDIAELLNSILTDFESAASVTEGLTKDMVLKLNIDFTVNPENTDDKFKIYDDYFDTVRYDEAPVEVFLDQVILICLFQLYDIIESAVAISEITIGVKGIQKVLQIIVDEIPNVVCENSLSSGTSLKKEFRGSDEKAINRWKVGHAFYALMLIFSRDALLRAVRDSDANELRSAITLFRASTAAMWFASIISPQMYIEVVRPSMISTKAPGGFSGHQNREFSNWAVAKRSIIKWLSEREELSTNMTDAARRFADNYLQDGEQHILLAAAMVQDRTSLVQDDVTEKYGVKMSKSAVQLLRDIQELRKTEVEFIHNLKI